MMARGVVGLSLGTVLVLLAFGCSTGTGLHPVHGKVLLDGEPAVGALVVFHPCTKPEKTTLRPSARVASDGSYKLGTYVADDGAPPGTYTVTIVMSVTRTEPSSRATVRKAQRFPARYAQPSKSPLSATVQAAPTEVPPFELSSSTP
jgi:hypothetical protein